MTPEELLALVKRVNSLSPPDRLRLAAALLEHRRASVALPIIRGIADELDLALLLAKGGPRQDRDRGKEGA